MATKNVNLQMTRGDSQQLLGTLTPATGRTFSTPISALRFTARRQSGDYGLVLQKTIGSGIAIVSQSSTSISYTIDFAPTDTSVLTGNNDLALSYDLELTEGNGWVSTPVGGSLAILKDIG